MQRREFIKNSALLAGTAAFAPNFLMGSDSKKEFIQCKGWATFDESGVLRPFNFKRRALEDDDILIQIKFSSVCHSDIHKYMGDWGKQKYPRVPGHEIAGIVTQVGKNVKNFKIGDMVGVGCMCDSKNLKAKNGQSYSEQYDVNTIFTNASPDLREEDGLTQGGYSDKIVVNSHFAVHIPENLPLEYAAPLMCAGVTTFSPLIKHNIKKGDEIAIVGIGGLGHLAIKIALNLGAKVSAFTTSKDKLKDIQKWGAKGIFVENNKTLANFSQKFDYLLSTIPSQFNVGAYASMVKPFGTFIQVGLPKANTLELNVSNFAFNRVNFTASLIGDMKETQEVVDFCAKNNIRPDIEIIAFNQVSDAWKKVLDKKARYRFVMDSKTL